MMKLATKHILTGDELTAEEISQLISLAVELQKDRLKYNAALKHQHLALLFEKPSLRTRFSFTVAMRECGGDVIESIQSTRKAELPADQIRVIQGYCHVAMIRTFSDSVLEQMASVSKIPIINGLSDLHHPCQILADLMTLQQRFQKLSGLTVCYLGDGNNILHSLLLMATKCGVRIHYCCPKDYGPNAVIVKKASERNPGLVHIFKTPEEAVKGSDAVYTDVWTSMGAEQRDTQAFAGFQVNEPLMKHANKNAIFMHCMPMNRGQEVSNTLPDLACSAIFAQSENRLHVQKALLLALLS